MPSVRRRDKDMKRSVGSHEKMMGGLNRASASGPAGMDRLWAGGEFQRRTPETHVNVVSENYHKKWTAEPSNPDYDDHYADEQRYKGTMPK